MTYSSKQQVYNPASGDVFTGRNPNRQRYAYVPYDQLVVYGQPAKVGHRIHVTHRGGQFEVIETKANGFKITCNKWQVEFERGQRKHWFECCTWAEYKAHVGAPNSTANRKAREAQIEQLTELVGGVQMLQVYATVLARKHNIANR